MLGGPNTGLFVKLHRAGMIRDREIGDRLILLGPLFEQRMDGLQLSEIIPPSFGQGATARSLSLLEPTMCNA